MPEIKEAVCVDCKRVYDSCADKDCITDVAVAFTNVGQSVIDTASTVKCRDCDVINCFVDVEEVPFNRGFYSVDITYFFKLMFDAYTNPVTPPVSVEGLATFSKKAILYGSDGRVKIFSSEFAREEFDEQLLVSNTNPIAKVQCVDPICMDVRLCKPGTCKCPSPPPLYTGIPSTVANQFQGEFALNENAIQNVIVTLGLFSIVQLERDVQILIPTYEFAVPTKECSCETDDPCDAFRKIKFPVDEFFPPNLGQRTRAEMPACIDNMNCCGCGTSQQSATETCGCSCCDS